MDLAPLAQRLHDLGIMDRPFNELSRDDVHALIQAVHETTDDTELAEHAKMAQGLYAYRTLAPCPRSDWRWVYRGQACAVCEDRDKGCVSWPSCALPSNIKPLRGSMPVKEK